MLFHKVLFIFLSISIIMFSISAHPMMLGLMIMFSTFIITITSGMFLQSFWISYILFLVFLGALLVLFIYMASLSPNELFMKIKLTTLITMLIIFITPLILNLNNNLFLTSFSIALKVSKLFSSSLFLVTLMTMLFLLFTLLSIMKITKFYKGPLRTTFN